LIFYICLNTYFFVRAFLFPKFFVSCPRGKLQVHLPVIVLQCSKLFCSNFLSVSAFLHAIMKNFNSLFNNCRRETVRVENSCWKVYTFYLILFLHFLLASLSKSCLPFVLLFCVVSFASGGITKKC